MAAMNTLALTASERRAAIESCQRDRVRAALGRLQAMHDTMTYDEFASDERNVDAAIANVARVGEFVVVESPLVSDATFPFHHAWTKMKDEFEIPPAEVWKLLGTARDLRETVLHRPLVRRFAKEELNPITCPNRHAGLPCPAKDATIAMLRDLSGELALLSVTAIALFGSVARGDDTPDSDIDIAVAIAGTASLALRIRVGKLVEVHTGRRVDVAHLPLRHPLDKTAAGDLVMVA